MDNNNTNFINKLVMEWGTVGEDCARVSYLKFLADSSCDYTVFETGLWTYDRLDCPDRPSRLKKCSSDRDDHMETLPGRSQMIANDPDDRDDRSRSGRL